jgi:hypothetical protein
VLQSVGQVSRQSHLWPEAGPRAGDDAVAPQSTKGAFDFSADYVREAGRLRVADCRNDKVPDAVERLLAEPYEAPAASEPAGASADAGS